MRQAKEMLNMVLVDGILCGSVRNTQELGSPVASGIRRAQHEGRLERSTNKNKNKNN